MASPFLTPEFKKLKKEYYDKLSESGFEDIEDKKERLKRSSTDVHRRIGFKSTDIYHQIFGYYLWAGSHSHHSTFESETDKKIWVYHSEGFSSREIAKVVPFDQSWICRKIKEIRKYLQNLAQDSSNYPLRDES